MPRKNRTLRRPKKRGYCDPENWPGIWTFSGTDTWFIITFEYGRLWFTQEIPLPKERQYSKNPKPTLKVSDRLKAQDIYMVSEKYNFRFQLCGNSTILIRRRENENQPWIDERKAKQKKKDRLMFTENKQLFSSEFEATFDITNEFEKRRKNAILNAAKERFENEKMEVEKRRSAILAAQEKQKQIRMQQPGRGMKKKTVKHKLQSIRSAAASIVVSPPREMKLSSSGGHHGKINSTFLKQHKEIIKADIAPSSRLPSNIINSNGMG